MKCQIQFFYRKDNATFAPKMKVNPPFDNVQDNSGVWLSRFPVTYYHLGPPQVQLWNFGRLVSAVSMRTKKVGMCFSECVCKMVSGDSCNRLSCLPAGTSRVGRSSGKGIERKSSGGGICALKAGRATWQVPLLCKYYQLGP